MSLYNVIYKYIASDIMHAFCILRIINSYCIVESRDGHEARQGEARRVRREASKPDTWLARLVQYPGAVGSPRLVTKWGEA